MIELGKMNRLEVTRRSSEGLQLGDPKHRVLLPRHTAPADTQVGDELSVFITLDREGRYLATTKEPKVTVGRFACLEVVDVNDHGAFLDWGLPKDLLVPRHEQVRPLNVGDHTVVTAVMDRYNRVMGVTWLSRHFNQVPPGFPPGAEVELMVYGANERGVLVVVEGEFSGMLFRDDTFSDTPIGATLTGFVVEVRADGKIDVSLRRRGRAARDENQARITDALHANGGFLALTDKSPPAAIQHELQMSKKAFKKALGGLYRARKIRLDPDGVRVLESPSS